MSKIAISAVLIRGAEDAEFREALKKDVKMTTVGYELTSEEQQHLVEIIKKISVATKEMEQKLFDEVIKPIIPEELPKDLATARCCGGGGAMTVYK